MAYLILRQLNCLAGLWASGLFHNRFSSDIESVQSTYPGRVSKAFAAGSEDAGF